MNTLNHPKWKLILSILFVFLLLIVGATVLYKIFKTPALRPSKIRPHYAYQVPAFVKTKYPKRAIGPTEYPRCENCFSRTGPAGFIIAEMLPNQPILNVPGRDFRIYQVDDSYLPIKTGAQFPTSYYVYAAQKLNEWQFVGPGYGITDFDLATGGLTFAHFIKIEPVDKSSGPLLIDAIERLDFFGLR